MFSEPIVIFWFSIWCFFDSPGLKKKLFCVLFVRILYISISINGCLLLSFRFWVCFIAFPSVISGICRMTNRHFSDVTLLFEQWIIFKNLQFILLFLNIWTLTVFGLKTRCAYCGTFVYQTTGGLFKVYFDFRNFHLTTQLRWPHYYTL